MQTLYYQTIQVESRGPLVGGPSAAGLSLAAGVKLLQKATVALNDWAVSAEVNRQMEARRAEILAKMPPNPSGGVLVCVGIQEWSQPDPMGSRARMFMDLYVVGGGMDAASVLRRQLAQPQMTQAPPHGWRRRDRYIWVTQSAS